MVKVWYKAKHKRKCFTKLPLSEKLNYYMQPFLHSIGYTWYEPLPFPCLLKLGYITLTLVLMCMPFFYFAAVLTIIYAEVEYFFGKLTKIEYADSWSILKLADEVLYQQTENRYYHMFVALYFERLRVMVFALTATIDYIRMALFIFTY